MKCCNFCDFDGIGTHAEYPVTVGTVLGTKKVQKSWVIQFYKKCCCTLFNSDTGTQGTKKSTRGSDFRKS